MPTRQPFVQDAAEGQCNRGGGVQVGRYGIWDSKNIQVQGGETRWRVPVDIILSTTSLAGS